MKVVPLAEMVAGGDHRGKKRFVFSWHKQGNVFLTRPGMLFHGKDPDLGDSPDQTVFFKKIQRGIQRCQTDVITSAQCGERWQLFSVRQRNQHLFELMVDGLIFGVHSILHLKYEFLFLCILYYIDVKKQGGKVKKIFFLSGFAGGEDSWDSEIDFIAWCCAVPFQLMPVSCIRNHFPDMKRALVI